MLLDVMIDAQLVALLQNEIRVANRFVETGGLRAQILFELVRICV